MQHLVLNVRFHVATGFFGRDQVRHTRPPGHGRGNGRRKARLERRHERPARPPGFRHTRNVRAPPLASLPQGVYVFFRARILPIASADISLGIGLGLGRQFVDTQFHSSSRLECAESVGVLELSIFAQFSISHSLEIGASVFTTSDSVLANRACTPNQTFHLLIFDCQPAPFAPPQESFS